MKGSAQVFLLGDVAAVGAGNSAPQEDSLFTRGSHPFVRTSDVGRVRFGTLDAASDYLNDRGIKGLRRVPKGTILFPKSGASTFLNHRVQMGMDGYVASHLATIEADPTKAEPRFLLYFLATVRTQTLVQDQNYPSLNLPAIKGISVPVPSLPEQRRIVAILDEAFEGIAAAKANAERNLRNAKEVFEGHMAEVFTEPTGEWESTTIGATVGFIDYRGKTPVKTEAGLRLITAKNVKMGRLLEEPAEYVAPSTYKSWMTRGIPKKGDILFTTEAPLANVAELDTDEKVVFAQRIIIMQPDEKSLHSTFLKYMLMSAPVQSRIHRQGTGATVKGIKSSLLKQIQIQFPRTLREQRRIAERLAAIEAASAELSVTSSQKLASLDDLKASLLHQAFTGAL
jgi:type I restriction enzyme S subunit